MRINILVEGESEETFVKQLLIDHLSHLGLYVYVQQVITSRDKRTGITYKGGVPNFAKVRNHLLTWTKQDHQKDVRFSSMFDFFRLPSDFPGYDLAKSVVGKHEQVKLLEGEFQKDLGDDRFIPYIQLHEFESLILSEPSKFSHFFLEKETSIKALENAVAKFESPELINDELPPSKLIEKYFSNYSKVKPAAANTIAEAIGLEKMRQSCAHFADWLASLESLALR